MNGACNRGGGVKNLFQLQSQFQRFLYQTLCVFPQIKDVKHIIQNFHTVIWVMSQWWDLVLGVNNLSMGICNGAHRLRILVEKLK